MVKLLRRRASGGGWSAPGRVQSGFDPRAGATIAVAALGLALTACAHTPEPRIVTREVQVPVAVRCGTDPGPAPAFSDSNEAIRAAKDIFEKTKLLLAGRAQRDGWIATLTASSAGCR